MTTNTSIYCLFESLKKEEKEDLKQEISICQFKEKLDNFYNKEIKEISQTEVLSYLLEAVKLKLKNDISYLNSLLEDMQLNSY